MAENATNILPILWENQWHKPLNQLREELGIIPAIEECSSTNLEKFSLKN